MIADLNSIIEILSRDAGQLEQHAQDLRRISLYASLDLESGAEVIDERAASIRKQADILQRWGIGIQV